MPELMQPTALQSLVLVLPTDRLFDSCPRLRA